MRASSARRRAATLAVSTGRPMPGNSGTGVQAPSGGGAGLGRPCAARTGTATQAATMSNRMGSEAIARARARQLDAASAGDETMPCLSPPHSRRALRSEEHTSELQSLAYLVCRLLLEKKKKKTIAYSLTYRDLDMRT